LVAQLRAQPATGGNCVSATIKLRGPSAVAGKPDLLCLQALSTVDLLSRGVGVSSATRRVAAHVYAVVMAAEQRGSTLCVVPAR
jgi:hypothetical protein